MKEFKYGSQKALSEVLDSQKTPEAKLEEINSMLIPVMNSAEQLEEFIKAHEEYLIIPFLFGRDDRELLLSTSRIHMNWMWTNVLYVPVNIKEDDNVELRKIYELASRYSNIIFFNHSSPHKSNSVMQELFEGELDSKNGDYVTRQGEEFIIADGNGAALVEQANRTPYGNLDFSKIVVVIVGIGGTGKLAAQRFYERGVRKDSAGNERLILVDTDDKRQFANEVEAKFFLGINELFADESVLNRLKGEHLIIIDATKEDEDKRKYDAEKLAEKYQNNNNIFIDCNMYVKRNRYESTLKGYHVAVGREFVETTNYIMTKKIIEAANSIGVKLESISERTFKNDKVLPSKKIVGKLENILSKNNILSKGTEEFKEELEREIRSAGLNKKQYCKFAWLNVVRALPYLSTLPGKDLSALPMKPFQYWHKDKRQLNLYNIFCDLDKTAEKIFINEGCELEKLNLDRRLEQVKNDTADSDDADAARNVVFAAEALVDVLKIYADDSEDKSELSSGAYEVAKYCAVSARLNGIDHETFLDVVISDLKNISEDDVPSLKLDAYKHERHVKENYEQIWENFLKDLRAVDCDYFADVYKHILENGFDETAKSELQGRIKVYDKIESENLEKSAAKMSETLGSQLKKRVEKSWPLIKKIGAILIAIIGFVSAIITIIAVFL